MKFENSDSPVDAAELALIDSGISLTLPSTLKGQYLNSNGGAPIPYVYEDDNLDTVVTQFLPIASAKGARTAVDTDNDDGYTVGQSVGVGVVILSVVVARKATRLGKGAKTTRGPPKNSTLQPGPFAKESIPGHRGRPTAAEQRQINQLMKKHANADIHATTSHHLH